MRRGDFGPVTRQTIQAMNLLRFVALVVGLLVAAALVRMLTRARCLPGARG